MIGLALGLLLFSALIFALLHPLPAGDAYPVNSRGTLTAATRWDLVARLAILRVELSRYGQPSARLARVLEQRIGPVQWTAAQADTWVRVVTAAGHLPAELYRRPYQERLRAFQECLDESRRAPGDERFVREWTCGLRKPPTEEEFARIEFQWRCVAMRCHWFSVDPAAWRRISTVPCRVSDTQECWHEVSAYLATGRSNSEP